MQIIGRYGTFRYNNADHSVETGLLAAKNILGEAHDLDRVNADQDYHEIKRSKPGSVLAADTSGIPAPVAPRVAIPHTAPESSATAADGGGTATS